MANGVLVSNKQVLISFPISQHLRRIFCSPPDTTAHFGGFFPYSKQHFRTNSYHTQNHVRTIIVGESHCAAYSPFLCVVDDEGTLKALAKSCVTGAKGSLSVRKLMISNIGSKYVEEVLLKTADSQRQNV
jgi:hypothetical protein